MEPHKQPVGLRCTLSIRILTVQGTRAMSAAGSSDPVAAPQLALFYSCQVALLQQGPHPVSGSTV